MAGVRIRNQRESPRLTRLFKIRLWACSWWSSIPSNCVRDLWGWGPQAPQPTHSLVRKRETSISYYFLSNCFCKTFFLCSSHIPFPCPGASQQKPVRKTRNWSRPGGGWSMKGPGGPGREMFILRMLLIPAAQPQGAPVSPALYITCPNGCHMPSISVSLMSPPWWGFSEKIHYNKMQIAFCLWKCP